MDDLAVEQLAHERHFIRRARERFGLNLNPKRYARIMAMLRGGADTVRFIGSGEGRDRTRWHVRAFGAAMIVVYDARTDRAVTCLESKKQPKRPKDWIHEQIEHDSKHKWRRMRMGKFRPRSRR